MSLDIILESGSEEVQGKIFDTHNLLLKLMKRSANEKSQCLQFIDPYGKTVFNRRQMSQFLLELNSLHLFVQNAEEEKLLSKIEELAKHCQQKPHLYIRLLGD